jgi:hypothetical protein
MSEDLTTEDTEKIEQARKGKYYKFAALLRALWLINLWVRIHE